MELQKLTEQEKLVHFELLFTGKAELIHEILPDKVKNCFVTAFEALCQHLNAIRQFLPN